MHHRAGGNRVGGEVRRVGTGAATGAAGGAVGGGHFACAQRNRGVKPMGRGVWGVLVV